MYTFVCLRNDITVISFRKLTTYSTKAGSRPSSIDRGRHDQYCSVKLPFHKSAVRDAELKHLSERIFVEIITDDEAPEFEPSVL